MFSWIAYVPIQQLFLYFALYSFLGWAMETCYCSIGQRRLVSRGFLYGPVCPIYGTGVVLMVLFFTPLKGNLILFFLVAVVVMSSWEYLVAWVLETTTHVKYWDYSNKPFNLHGRICLAMSLAWGVLSYLVLFWIQPPVERIVEGFPLAVQYSLAGVLAVAFLVDAAFTIRHLALLSKLVAGVSVLSEELQVQMALGKAELGDKLDAQREALRAKYNDQVVLLEKYSRRFRNSYSRMSVSRKYRIRLEDIKAAADLAREELQRKRQEIQSRLSK